ncbi:MAG: type II CRISPR RNA-guided endonuclease Cas9 [Chthoniobacteraceae bacterium]|jgi:CRISPR-associated endonuclease Csn1
MSTIWSFDLGKASIGEAVRDTEKNDFLHKAREAWLDEVWRAAGVEGMPEPLQKRRIGKMGPDGNLIPRSDWKKKKGKWMLEQKADYRLEREFAPKLGEKTKDGAPSDDAGTRICYTSCLLRIKLLRGKERLEPWQIYKALHSAIQRRGYDPNIPWKAKESRRQRQSRDDDEKALTRKRMDRFVQELTAMIPEREEFQMPCYFDAWKMGLWDPATPEVLRDRIGCHALSTRDQIVPRWLVEKEIRLLAMAAGRQIPGLKDNADYLLWGPAETPYASYYSKLRKAFGLREGAANDWRGVVGQKIPLFDNRIIEKCSLIPRLQVCTVNPRFDADGLPYPDTLLPSEVTFLWKLKNLRFLRGKTQTSLQPEELRILFQHPDPRIFRVELKTWGKYAREFCWDTGALPAQIRLPKKKGHTPKREELVGWFARQLLMVSVTRANGVCEPLNGKEIAAVFGPVLLKSYALTEAQWRQWLEDHGAALLPNYESVDPPKPKGRASRSRPALKLLREFILAGLSPTEFRVQAEEKIDRDADPKRGVVRADLAAFCAERMGATWHDAYPPNERLALAVENVGPAADQRKEAIGKLIARQNDPIVRHRLGFFAERLATLSRTPDFDPPNHVVLEFVRDNLPESFLSQNATEDYETWLRDNQRKALKALEIVKQLGATGRDAVLKYRLLEAQGFECVYFPNGSLDTTGTRSKLAETPCIYTNERVGVTNLDDLVIDHIVPQKGGFNGPDSFLNKVVTTRIVNERLKKCRTPFQWFHADMPTLWKAYVERVRKLAPTLGRKKVALLTEEDAPRLAQRYTGLAETAWIARLAQAIVCIHFGWNFGVDEERRRRITVVSGGLTSRIRRAYDLDSLLYRDREEFETTGRKKNREDDRHHALDAMVINFIPSWASNLMKESFFQFPKGVHRGFFAKEISTVRPRYEAWERPKLEDKFYGQRQLQGSAFIVCRELLIDFASKEEKGKRVMRNIGKLPYERIVDGAIREAVQRFFEENPACSVEQWKKFCGENLRVGEDGASVVKVMMTRSKANKTEEYTAIGKTCPTQRQQLKRGANHAGYFIYDLPAPTRANPGARDAKVAPVFAHQRRQDVEARAC